MTAGECKAQVRFWMCFVMSMQPRVGIWMAGISTLEDCHLWAAAMSFLMSQTSSDKLLQTDMAFLVAVFLQGQPLHQVVSELL